MTHCVTPSLVHRRTFLADLGRGAFAVALVGLAGCGTSPGTPSSSRPSSTAGLASPSASAGGSTVPEPASGDPGGGTSGPGVQWSRVNLGFVAAYVLARGGEAAIVDTGVAGSADEIETTLRSVGLDWAAVGHVILTHRHGDHVGSAADVLGAASAATGYAGAADLSGITAPRLTAVEDGDSVFDLTIVATPGHTAGHIAVLDRGAGILVAGDALNTRGGTLLGSPPEFTEDAEAARASVAKLAALRFETLLVGHGEPIEGGASDAVAALAAAG